MLGKTKKKKQQRRRKIGRISNSTRTRKLEANLDEKMC
jgi:hypothetical protein